MSEFSECNYCILQRMKEKAKQRGVEVVIGNDDGWTTARYSDQEYLAVSFLEITSQCAC